MNLSHLLTSAALTSDGSWVEHPEAPGVAFKLSSTRQPAYVQFLTDGYAKVREQLGLEEGAQIPLDSPEYLDLLRSALVDWLIKDWRGIDDAPYSREAARAMASDPEADDLCAWIYKAAADKANFRKSLEEELQKKS